MNNANNTHRIFGYVPLCGSSKRPIVTAKAVRATVVDVDGEEVRAATVWLPRSIARDLKIVKVNDPENGVSYELTATVPAWWVRKLDTRAAWQVAGHRAAPFATLPW